jgi:hypothetical protein
MTTPKTSKRRRKTKPAKPIEKPEADRGEKPDAGLARWLKGAAVTDGHGLQMNTRKTIALDRLFREYAELLAQHAERCERAGLVTRSRPGDDQA